MTALFAFIILFCNLLAPAPHQVVINPETKECGYYWGGDEYAWYHLSSQWIIVDPNSPIQIEGGVYEWDGNISNIESFCEQIGYAYVPGNLGKVRGQYRLSLYVFILLAIRFAPLIFVIMVLFVALVLFLRWANKQGNNASPT
jgi:hypothetical protein